MGHGLLDFLGLIPGAGEFADGANALWCLLEGDIICASLSAGAMVPFAGWGAFAGKGAKTLGPVLDDAANSAARGADDTVDLYRAVGVKEYDTVMSTGHFEPGGISMNARQFALTLDEAIGYANTDPAKVAILRATVNRSSVEGIADFSTTIDPWIFRNGVYTVQPGTQSDIFHAGLRGITHAY